MKIKQAIIKGDIVETENIIKKRLIRNPTDIQLWFKLCLTELQFPFEDYESALQCIDHIYEMEPDNLYAIILETGIKWHSFGFIDEGLFERIIKIKCYDEKTAAIINYLQALYYQFNKETKKQKSALEKSIKLYDGYVYPNKDLGQILLNNLQVEEGKRMLKKAASNVRKVYLTDEAYNFTDKDTYIAEFITGTNMSRENFENMKQLL